MKKPFLHVYLFAVYPILRLYSYNIAETAFSEIVLPLIITLAAVSVLLFVLRKRLKHIGKAALLTSLITFTFFSYGHTLSLLNTKDTGYSMALAVGLMAIFTAIWALVYYFLDLYKGRLDIATGVYNTVALVLVAFQIVNIFIYVPKKDFPWDPSQEIGEFPVAPPASKVERDVYFFIFDRYAGETTLTDRYGFDNSGFIDDLTERGFYVASESASNYLKTAPSLASNLNMDYINFLTEEMGANSKDWKPMAIMIEKNRVVNKFKELGYRYYHFGSWWHATDRSELADVNVNLSSLTEFSTTLLWTTPLNYLGSRNGVFGTSELHFMRVKHQLEELYKIIGDDSPKYVFVHFLLPHEPYVFDEDATFVPEEVAAKRSEEENYIRQLKFTNQTILNILDLIHSKSEIEPVVIIQSDEGSFPRRYAINEKTFSWDKATDEEIFEKTEILNALYLPDVDSSLLKKDLSPVNTFRIVFNQYFGFNYQILPDRHFAFKNMSNPYNFFEITEKIREYKKPA